MKNLNERAAPKKNQTRTALSTAPSRVQFNLFSFARKRTDLKERENTHTRVSLLRVPFLNFFMKRDEEGFTRKEKGGGWFSLFFFLLDVENVAISYVKVYTHAQILSEANFAKQRRFGVLFTQRRGVLFRTRRRQRSRGALGTRKRVLRFSFFLERCLMRFDVISFVPVKEGRSPFVVR